MYSPETGRYLQPNPSGSLVIVNPYTYCNNDPVNSLDQSGLGKEQNKKQDELSSSYSQAEHILEWIWVGVLVSIGGAVIVAGSGAALPIIVATVVFFMPAAVLAWTLLCGLPKHRARNKLL